MFPPSTPHILYPTHLAQFPIPCIGHALGILRSRFMHSLWMICPFPPTLPIKITFIFQGLAIKPLPEKPKLIRVRINSLHFNSSTYRIIAIHFRSLTQICRYQLRFPEPLRAEPFLMPLGIPIPPKDFCNLKGFYASCACLLPDSRQQPRIERWASLALTWPLLIPIQEDSFGPASLVTHLKPVFWLPSLAPFLTIFSLCSTS